MKYGIQTIIVLALLLLVPSCQVSEEEGFTKVFDGKSLNGWIQKGGTAKYQVEDGQIIGTSVPDTPNSFLCTERTYADFILELEFKVDPSLNSGIQIRSQVFDHETEIVLDGEVRKIPAGRVHGYQVEIDPSERAWTGGIYDEARRGWLNNLEENQQAGQAFIQGEWNHFRIVCDGSSIKTWINGVSAADLNDDMTLEGLIALQVHGVGEHTENAGKQIRWRNIRIKELE